MIAYPMKTTYCVAQSLHCFETSNLLYSSRHQVVVFAVHRCEDRGHVHISSYSCLHGVSRVRLSCRHHRLHLIPSWSLRPRRPVFAITFSSACCISATVFFDARCGCRRVELSACIYFGFGGVEVVVTVVAAAGGCAITVFSVRVRTYFDGNLRLESCGEETTTSLLVHTRDLV